MYFIINIYKNISNKDYFFVKKIMGQTLFKSSDQNKIVSNEIVFQITKLQLIKFLQFIIVLAMLTLNILAIKISSPFLKELLVSQAILLLILFIKKINTNNRIN